MRIFAKLSSVRQYENKLSLRSLVLALHKLSFARQYENKFSLRSLVLAFTEGKNEMTMRKGIVWLLCFTLMLSGCTTNTGMGTYVGAQFGSILGSAIGGLSGGPRGADVGTVVGMVGGAVVGAAVGSAADKAAIQQRQGYYAPETAQQEDQCGAGCAISDGQSPCVTGQGAQSVMQLPADSLKGYSDELSGFDASNSGDDRLYDFQQNDSAGDYGEVHHDTVKPVEPAETWKAADTGSMPNVEIRNVHFVDDSGDGFLSRGEGGKVIFEVMNRGAHPLSNVVPSVALVDGNRHIAVSPSVEVERIAPGQGIRYTAMVQADNRLRDGRACFALTVLQDNKSICRVVELNVLTRK